MCPLPPLHCLSEIPQNLTPEPPVFAVRTCQLCGAKLQDTVITRTDSPDLVLKESISQAMEEVMYFPWFGKYLLSPFCLLSVNYFFTKCGGFSIGSSGTKFCSWFLELIEFFHLRTATYSLKFTKQQTISDKYLLFLLFKLSKLKLKIELKPSYCTWQQLLHTMCLCVFSLCVMHENKLHIHDYNTFSIVS